MRRIRVWRGVGVLVASAAMLGVSTVGVSAVPAVWQIADSSASVVTADGWVLRVDKTAESARSVTPLDFSPLSREAFWDMRAAARIEGAGSVAVIGGLFEFGLQVGCQLDMSGGGAVGSSMGPTAQVTVSAVPGVSVGVTGQFSVTGNVRPGAITTVPIKRFPLAGERAAGSVSGVHVAVSGCVGVVSVRSYVQFSTATVVSQDQVSAYGDRVRL